MRSATSVMTAASDAATAAPRRSLLHLGSLTPSGKARVPFSWALYDFANTVFSYAVVSFAMGLWLTAPGARPRAGQRSGDLQRGRGHQRRPQCPVLARARRDERPRRSSAAVPALLHGPGHRALVDHRLHVRGPGRCPLRHRQLRLPGRAHLLRRDRSRPSAGPSPGAGCRASASASATWAPSPPASCS